MIRPRVLLGAGSVAIVVVVASTATALGPDHARLWLLLCGVVAIAAATQSAALDPTDVTPALLFSLPPVAALVADGSPTWLIGPLAALLLVAGELNALSWECQGATPMSAVQRRRLLHSGRLASLGLAASLAVAGVAAGVAARGTAAVVAAAAAIAALGHVVFRHRR